MRSNYFILYAGGIGSRSYKSNFSGFKCSFSNNGVL